MAWIDSNAVTREIGRLTSENHDVADITQAIVDATATAEGVLRVIVSDTELKTWDTEGVCPTDVVLQVARIAAALLLSRQYGQNIGSGFGQPSSKAADLNRLALKELGKYASGEKRLVSKATDDQIPVSASVKRTNTNTTRKFDIGDDTTKKKLDRF